MMRALYNPKLLRNILADNPSMDKRKLHKELTKAMKTTDSTTGSSSLGCAFNWASSKQGHSYWMRLRH